MLLARAVYDNAADSPDELSFTQGDVLVVLEQAVPNMAGWWLCSFHGRIGLVPGNRLRLSLAAEDEDATVGGMVHSHSAGNINSSVKVTVSDRPSSDLATATAAQSRPIPVQHVVTTEYTQTTVNSQRDTSDELADYDIPSNKPLYRPGPPRNLDPAHGLRLPVYGSTNNSNSINSDYDSPSSRLASSPLTGGFKAPGHPGSLSVNKDPGYPGSSVGILPSNPGTRSATVESHSLPGRGSKGTKSVTFSSQLTHTSSDDTNSQSAYRSKATPSSRANPDRSSGVSSSYDSLPPQKNLNHVTYDSLPHRTLFAHNLNGRLPSAESATLTVPRTISRSPLGHVRIKDANSDYDTLRNMLVSVQEEHATATASNVNVMRVESGASAAAGSVAMATKQQPQEDATYDIPRPYPALSSTSSRQQTNSPAVRRIFQQQQQKQTSVDRQSTYDIPPLVYSAPSSVAVTPSATPPGDKTVGKGTVSLSEQAKLTTVEEQGDGASNSSVKTVDAWSSNCDKLLEDESATAASSAPSTLARASKISSIQRNNDREKRLGVRVSYEQPISKDVMSVAESDDQSEPRVNVNDQQTTEVASSKPAAPAATILKQLGHVTLNDSDRQLLAFYRGHVSVNVASLAGACHNLQATLRDRKLLKAFVARCKCVIMRAHNLLYIADTITRNIFDEELCEFITDMSNGLCEHVRSMVLSTKLVAAQYSPTTLQTLVDNSQAVLDTSQRFSSIFRLVDE